MKLISVKCPECGATLNIEEGREQAFCTYCGTKVLLHNENEYIYRHIDEAGVKQAETDRIVRMKQMELAKKKEGRCRKDKSLKNQNISYHGNSWHTDDGNRIHGRICIWRS